MDRLNLEILNRASLPRITSTERINDEKSSVGRDSAYRACLFYLSPPGQERCHWLVFLSIRVSVTKLDINDGVDLTTP